MEAPSLHAVGDELDRLCEMANVGAGHAATALARLMGRPIRMQVPRVRMGAASASSADASNHAWIFFDVHGGMGGSLVLHLDARARAILIRELGDHGPVDSALREVGNIVASHALSAIADLVGARVLPSLPSLVVEPDGPAVAAWRSRTTGRLCIETPLVDESGRLALDLVWIPADAGGGAARAPF